MTTSYYIDKAIHALNTDQPNLAMLYMRRGIVESKRLNPNPMLDIREGVKAFGESMASLFQVFEEVASVFYTFGTSIARVYEEAFEEIVRNYNAG